MKISLKISDVRFFPFCSYLLFIFPEFQIQFIMDQNHQEQQDNHHEHSDHEGVYKQDLDDALTKKLGTKNFLILDYNVEHLTNRIGLLGDHAYITVTFLNTEGDKENTTFFIKFFPKLEAVAKFAEGVGAFKKEMFVYELLEDFKALGIDLAAAVTPTCYFAKYNKYLFLDNLIEEGYSMPDKHKFLDYDTINGILQSLARLHACSILYEEKNGKTLLDDHLDDFEESFFNDKEDFINLRGVDASIKGILKSIEIFGFPHQLRSGKIFKDVAKEVCYKIYDLVKPSKKYRNVLCHGDLWATNFLLKYDEQTKKFANCKFVDFQCGRYVPPSQDVLSLLYLTTSREFRSEHLYESLGMYYSGLERHLKMSGIDSEKILPFEQFLESCDEQKVFAIIQTAIFFPLVLIETESIEEYFSDVDLNQKALFEDRSYLVLAHKDKDEKYCERLKESIQDLMEYCEYL